MSIKLYYDKIAFRIRRSGEIKEFLEKVIREEKKIPGDLYFIFTDDKAMILINREFLNHDYYTDVIAFNYSKGNSISGEIYISAETVKRNAKLHDINIFEEVLRVMIHGVLHLCGYSDADTDSRTLMFERQEERVRAFLKR